MTFLNLPVNLFFIFFFFFIYVKTSKNLSAKCYKENKERLPERLVKDIRIVLTKKKKKSDNMVVNVTKIFQKMKKINWLNIEKIEEKMLYSNYSL